MKPIVLIITVLSFTAVCLIGCPKGQGGDPALVGTWQGTGTASFGGEIVTVGITRSFGAGGGYSSSVRVGDETFFVEGTYDADPNSGVLVTYVDTSTPYSFQLLGRGENNYEIEADTLRVWDEDSEEVLTRVFKSGEREE